ncbi:MAG TPA: hypothetical protein PK760_01145 [Flavobacteriales bacterium]|nr:hypothetical protein [Flavobacteriales bacterium]
MSITLRLAIPLALFAIIACSAQPAEKPSAKVQELTPPSELALLMRYMVAHADSVKAHIARNEKSLPPYPAEIKKLFTAKPTDGMHIDPITFPTFGKDYQNKVDALYKAARKDRLTAYNALVQSCANCHGTHCPGPLMRIKKMYVKAEQ